MHFVVFYFDFVHAVRRSQWPRSLRRRSAAARLRRLRVRIPDKGMDYLSVVCVVCCAGTGLCDELITRPEEPTECGALLCVI